jgi:hypothetical protein
MYENDYIFQMVTDLATSANKILFDSNCECTSVSLPSIKDVETRKKAEYMLEMIDKGQAEEAEEQLYIEIKDKTADNMMMGYVFYLHLAEKDDALLMDWGYSRKKIKEGIKHFSAQFGIEEMVDLFLYD